MNIRSSWNSDRVASCCCKKAASHQAAPRSRCLIAQYRGREVSVLGPRGGKIHSWVVAGDISSALIRNGILTVQTVDGASYVYDAAKGALISSTVPVKEYSGIHVATDVAA